MDFVQMCQLFLPAFRPLNAAHLTWETLGICVPQEFW
jgi:hypothetical protein